MKLHELARAAGLTIDWHDASHRPHRVSDESLAAILHALGYPADSERAADESLALLAEKANRPPALLTVDAGSALVLPPAMAQTDIVHLIAEDGAERSIRAEHGRMEAVNEPGYYRIIAGAREAELAVAPHTCLRIEDITESRIWGPAVQIPALRGARPHGFGNLGDLARAAERFAAAGADAIAISPIHALYPDDGGAFSPYSPSSRQFLNTALADPELAGLPPLAPRPEPPLIDWAEEIPAQYQALQGIFAQLDGDVRQRFETWAEEGGEALHRHALFDALRSHFAHTGAAGWQGWPPEYHDPAHEAARAFASRNADTVRFHLFAQWLASEGLQRVQSRARAAGMAVGTIADLAVGVDPGGSDSWSMRDALLTGLTIGAPPDPLGPDGQNWGLTTFSPEGLERHGFRPWLEMLRSALRACGGLRIDHAFGLRRLWVVPQGAGAMDGAYLTYPFDDLLRLLALESRRARALIIAEDLGTMPPHFRESISSRAMLGMRVLWFERNEEGGFKAGGEYEAASAAMTGTHDLPTVAGWWRGRDIDWNRKLGRGVTDNSREAADNHRAHERWQLWGAVGKGRRQPDPDQPADVVDAATEFVAGTASRLAIIPLEDVLGLEEQPNLPGTINEHPNWRRRLPRPLDEMLAEPKTEQRLEAIEAARSQ